jgi:hypothetical protein
MPEYFIMATSFAAPFFSDTSDGYVTAETPEAALERFAADYRHPCGLYAAVCYASADAYHKGETPLARWLSNHELAIQRLKPKGSGYGYLGHGPGDFEIDGVRHRIEDPKGGRVLRAAEDADDADACL